jgi:hypothetical protein
MVGPMNRALLLEVVNALKAGKRPDLAARLQEEKPAGRPPSPRDAHGFKIVDVERAKLWIEMERYCGEKVCTDAVMIAHFAVDEGDAERLWKIWKLRNWPEVRRVLAEHPDFCVRNISAATFLR